MTKLDASIAQSSSSNSVVKTQAKADIQSSNTTTDALYKKPKAPNELPPPKREQPREENPIKLENQRTARDQVKFPFKGKEGAANPMVRCLLSSHE